MYTVVMNGNPDAQGREFDGYLDDFIQGLEKQGQEVNRIDLRELNIKYCSGCWSCWRCTGRTSSPTMY